jgi:membrane protease YdiL (CAAX protease family)
MGLSFLGFTLAWTWLFWSGPVALQGDVWSPPSVVFLYLGGAGPLVGGLLFTCRAHGRDGLKDLARRTLDPRRIGPVWWMAVIGLVPAIEAAAYLVAATTDQAQATAVFAPVLDHLLAPQSFLSLAVFSLLLGPLPEEVGWRGFGLDALQQRLSPLFASLLLAAVWGIWHLPLFLMDGYYTPFGGPPNPVHFGYDLLLTTLLLTWIFNHTGRSVLAAVLFHFLVNFSDELVASAPGADLMASVITTLVVLAVIAAGGLRAARARDQRWRSNKLTIRR